MGNCNIKKRCENSVQYVCRCSNSQTFCCEIHLKEHLKIWDRNHNFDSIPSRLCKWTKDGFLEFLTDEMLEKAKLMTMILDFFAQNSDIPISTIEKHLNEFDSNLKDISNQIENISQMSDKEEGLLANPWILWPYYDAERAEDILSNSLDSNSKLFCRLGHLRNKRLAILNKTINDSEIEKDFRRTCALYENDTSNFLLSKAYKEYVKSYQKIASLYLIFIKDHKINLFIYDTESQKEEMKVLKNIPSSFFRYTYKTSIIQLPNGKLCAYCNDDDIFYIFNILDWNQQLQFNYQYRSFQKLNTAIYFNKSIYCFWYNFDPDEDEDIRCNFTSRFDLSDGRWIELAPMGNSHEEICCSIIFNENVLFSEFSPNLFLYSIDINSFSTIPYKFSNNIYKILINGENRLYLIECKKYGWIYESDVENEYNWQKISPSKIHDEPYQSYSSYNKGNIYISACINQFSDYFFREYFKFDLKQKQLYEISCYGDVITLESLEGKIDTNHYVGCDSYYNKIGITTFYLAYKYNKIGLLKRKIEEDYEVIDAYICIGNIYYELDNYLESIKMYNKAIEIDPKYSFAYWRKGKVLHDLSQNIEALKCYNKAIELYSLNECFYECKGKVLHDLGKNIEALECYNKAIEIYSYNAWDYEKKGKILHELGRNLEEIECYSEAIRLKLDDPKIFCSRAILLNDLGQEVEAMKDLQNAYDIASESFNDNDIYGTSIQECLELLKMLPKLLEKTVKAKEELQKIKDLCQKNPEILSKAKEKESIIKEQGSKIIKRAVELFIEDKKSIEEIKQMKVEVDEHQKAMIDIVFHLWEMLFLQEGINE